MTTLFSPSSSGLLLVTDDGAGTYPAWQPGRKLTIANTVGGFSAAGIFGIPPSEAAGSLLNASQLGSFIWNGVQFCRCPDSGSGSGFEIYALNSTAENTHHQYNGTEPGKSGETPPLDGMTNLLGQGFTDATGKNAIRVVKPAAWIGPGESTGGGGLSLVSRDVTEFVNTITYTWGLAGNDHIIRIDNSIVIPVDANLQALTQLSVVPFFQYCPNFAPKAFDTQKWVNLATGATRAYAADRSVTETLMGETADTNFACAQVFSSGLFTTAGVDTLEGYAGSNGSGAFPFINSYAWCVKKYPGGIPAGTLTFSVYWCFGAEADVITAIVAAAAAIPAASYP